LAFLAPRRRAVNVFVADFLNRLRWNAYQLPRPASGRLEFSLSWPTLVMLEGAALGAVAVVPNGVDRMCRRVEFPARRLVLDAQAKGFEREFGGGGLLCS
jgi:hypothetical protein